MIKQKHIYNILIFLCLCGLAFFSYQWWQNDSKYIKSKVQYIKIRNDVESKRNPPVINFQKLKKKNKSVIGWIYVKGTKIDYPIMQAKNNSYYLHKGLYDQYLYSGSIFMNTYNKKDYTDNNTIIFGHHMNDGSMFADLQKYLKQSFYEKHRIVYLYQSPEKQGVPYEVIAAYKTSSNSNLYRTDYHNLAKINEQSVIHTTLAKNNKKLVTLSTCYHGDYQNKRVVVILQKI